MIDPAVAHVELPYDQGHQWHLVVGGQRAVVSERSAMVLIGRFGIPESSGQLQQDGLAGTAEEIGNDYRLSKKARELLESVGVEIGS